MTVRKKNVNYFPNNSMVVKFTNKYICLCLVLLSIHFLCNLKCSATHIMGGQITYKYIGNYQYRITLKGYRDCNGVLWHLGSPISIAPTGDYFDLDSIGRYDITPLCTGQVSACDSVGMPYGVHEYVEEKTITLFPPYPIGGYRLSFFDGNRNCSITTLEEPCHNTFYISTILDPLVSPKNSSPQFLNPPAIYVCVGQTFHYNNGAYDLDGDSLAYSLVPCLQEYDSSVTYKIPFSETNPLTSNPPLTLDPISGELQFTPTVVNEISVVAIRVEEFRNGIKIGEVVRDIQITVLPCNNELPVINTVPSVKKIIVYPGIQT